MKRGTKMLIIMSILVVIGVITWVMIVFFGRSETLSVKFIEKLNGDLYLIHLMKPENITWKSGSYARLVLPDIEGNEQEIADTVSGATLSNNKNNHDSRWLTIASTMNDDEILILTHNTGSIYKKSLTVLPAGSKVEMSWIYSHLSITDGKEPIVCFASDVGIAAIRPIIKEWVGKKDIILSHLDKGVTVFDEEITNLSNKVTNLTYETVSGLSQSQQSLKNAVDKYGNKATYILAGQPDDVKAMKKFLEEGGINSEKIKVDSFTGLK